MKTEFDRCPEILLRFRATVFAYIVLVSFRPASIRTDRHREKTKACWNPATTRNLRTDSREPSQNRHEVPIRNSVCSHVPAAVSVFSVFSSDPNNKLGHPHADVVRDFLPFHPIQIDKTRDFSLHICCR